MSNFPCLEARILGGAFVHEGWTPLCDTRLIALCESAYVASDLCRALAARLSEDDGRHYIVTDARGGEQQIWNRARLLREAEKAS